MAVWLAHQIGANGPGCMVTAKTWFFARAEASRLLGKATGRHDLCSPELLSVTEQRTPVVGSGPEENRK